MELNIKWINVRMDRQPKEKTFVPANRATEI
jgi:hypothetical protein